jgi:hypothetical protein
MWLNDTIAKAIAIRFTDKILRNIGSSLHWPQADQQFRSLVDDVRTRIVEQRRLFGAVHETGKKQDQGYCGFVH